MGAADATAYFRHFSGAQDCSHFVARGARWHVGPLGGIPASSGQWNRIRRNQSILDRLIEDSSQTLANFFRHVWGAPLASPQDWGSNRGGDLSQRKQIEVHEVILD